MDAYKSLEFLKRFVDKNIDTSKPTTESENGVRALCNLVQQDYKFDLGLRDNQTGRPLNGLVDAVKVSYPHNSKWIEKFADRDYVSDVILKRNIDPERYVKAINHYNSEWRKNEGYLQFDDGYELTHWIWALSVICKDNHIMHTYRDLMANSLINVYKTMPASDLKTESLYFLTLIDLPRVKEQWIIDLEKTQKKDGTFQGVPDEITIWKDFPLDKKTLKLYSVHHICLALLAIYNYYNNIREH